MTKLGHPIFGTTESEISEVFSILKKTKNPQLTKREIESLIIERWEPRISLYIMP